jgi:hypothetical protein
MDQKRPEKTLKFFPESSPTQVQIEAAAEAIFYCQHSVMHDHLLEWHKSNQKLWRECATAALTAAIRALKDEP